MSGNVVAWVYEKYPVATPLDRNRKVILSEVAEAADRDFENAHPGVDKVASHWGFDPGTVRRHLKALEVEGWLEVTERGGGRGKATVFRVCRERGAQRTGFDGAEGSGNARIPADKRAHSEPDTRAFPNLSPTVSSSNSPKDPPAADRLLDAGSSVEVVFAAWLACASPSGRARLDKARTRLIANALRDYPAEDVAAAVQGWQHDPWHRDRKKNDLGYLLRDAEHIEKFRDLWNAGPTRSVIPRPGRAVDEDREGPSGRIQL